jgi:hypothetical protein
MNGNQEDRLDAMLTTALVPPKLSSSFRVSLARRLDEPTRSFPSDALPDILHLASGAILTAFAASAAVEGTVIVVAVGTMATAASYFLLAVLRNSFDDIA